MKCRMFVLPCIVLILLITPLFERSQEPTDSYDRLIENLGKANEKLQERTSEYSPFSTAQINDTLDQEQSNHSGHAVAFLNDSWYFAQRFSPTMNILTKIQLFLGRAGTVTEETTFEVSLRRYLHTPLATIQLNISNIPENGSWFTADFNFYPVAGNYSYYIVCHATNVCQEGYIEWYFDSKNPYEEGCPFFSEDGQRWEELTVYDEFTGIDFCFRTYGFINSAPAIPIKPSGPSEAKFETPYTYTTHTVDADADDIYFMWSWGDYTHSEWLGPYSSHETCKATHSWMIVGSYLIMVKAKDQWGFESDWSEPLTIRMKKTRFSFDYQFISNLFSLSYIS